MGLPHAGRQSHRPCSGGGGGGEPFQMVECRRQMAEDQAGIGFEGARALQQRHRQLKLAGLQRQHAKAVDGVGLIGANLQDGAIALFRQDQPPGNMVRVALVQKLLDGDHLGDRRQSSDASAALKPLSDTGRFRV